MRTLCVLFATVFLLTAAAIAKDQPRFKSVEIKHFSLAEGVELPPQFSDYLYAELRADLQKKKVTEQLVGEDEVVDAADAPQSMILEGSVLEYKKGSLVKEKLIGFGAGLRSLTAHVKLLRRSNNEAVIDKDLKVRASSQLDPKALAKFLAGQITRELRNQGQ
jgi:uncharacterized protein DUF4410